MTESLSVALIGAGSMGGALLKGWLSAGSIDPARSAIFDPAAKDDIAALCKSAGLSFNPQLSNVKVDALVIAVKPQAANEALPAYARLAKDAMVISIMAGKSIASVSKALGGALKVARVMPNLPAAIGKGVCGIYAPEAIDNAGRSMIETLMSAAGDVVWVDREGLIDVVTAVSGSGPAYYFLLTEALAEAGEKQGLSKDAAAKLALATLTGAGALMESETRTPAEMRRAVTSPGGTTEAALKIFNGDEKALRALVDQAVEVATKRGRELTD